MVWAERSRRTMPLPFLRKHVRPNFACSLPLPPQSYNVRYTQAGQCASYLLWVCCQLQKGLKSVCSGVTGSSNKLAWLSEDESQCMHASSYLPRFPKLVSHTNGRSLAPAWPKCSAGYSFGLPRVRNAFCQSNAPSLFLYASVSPSSTLFVAICSQLLDSLCAGLGGPVWNVVRGWGGGQAGLKGDVQLFPHTASTPDWSVAHLAI